MTEKLEVSGELGLARSDMEKLLDLMEERQTAKAKREAELVARYEEGFELGKEEGLKAKADELKTWAEEKGAPLVMDVAKPGSGGEMGDNDTFMYWMRTGDEVAARKALQEGDAAEGGYLVPDDFVARITEKRDNASFVRAMGVQVVQTSRDAIEFPTESTSLTKFSRTAEEGAYSTNDPSFAQNLVTVHKWTKLTKISEELLEDDATNLEEWYSNAVGRAMAQTEAYYVAVGSGTNQHAGIFVGGTTDGLTFDSSGNITPDEIYELFMKLKTGYQSNAAWLMDNDTWRYLITLRDTNNWAFGVADMATLNTQGGVQAGTLYGHPVFLQDDIDTRAASKTVIMVGDPYYYGLVERRGLSVSRNPYLYQANGQVGFFNSFRQGGKVLVSEAWQGGIMST